MRKILVFPEKTPYNTAVQYYFSFSTMDEHSNIAPEGSELPEDVAGGADETTATPAVKSPYPPSLFSSGSVSAVAPTPDSQEGDTEEGPLSPPTSYATEVPPESAEMALGDSIATGEYRPHIDEGLGYDENSPSETGATDAEKSEKRKKLIKNLVLGAVLLSGIGFYVNNTFLHKGVTEEQPAQQPAQAAVDTGATAETGTEVPTSTGSEFSMAESPLALLYGTGTSSTGALQFNGTVMAQIGSADGSVGLIFNTRTKYSALAGDTKASLMFKGLKFIGAHPSFFGGSATRILAMGKAFYSEALGSGFFQIDNIVAPDSVKKTFQKTIDTYTSHWAQYQTSGINPKTTMNAFSAIASTIKSKDDFDSLFSTKPFGTTSSGAVSESGSVSGTGSTESGATASGVTYYLNPASSLKDKVVSNLDPMVASILFAPDTKASIYLENDTGKVKITVEFPSSLYFKDSSNTGTGTLTIDGVITPAETGVENEPTDSRMWGSEYIDSLSNSSSFEPLSSTGASPATSTGTGVVPASHSGGQSSTGAQTQSGKYSDVYYSGASVPLLPNGKHESDGVDAD